MDIRRKRKRQVIAVEERGRAEYLLPVRGETCGKAPRPQFLEPIQVSDFNLGPGGYQLLEKAMSQYHDPPKPDSMSGPPSPTSPQALILLHEIEKISLQPLASIEKSVAALEPSSSLIAALQMTSDPAMASEAAADSHLIRGRITNGEHQNGGRRP